MKVCNSAQNLTMFLRFVLDFMISASSFDESLAGIGGVNKRIVVNVVVVSVSMLFYIIITEHGILKLFSNCMTVYQMRTFYKSNYSEMTT